MFLDNVGLLLIIILIFIFCLNNIQYIYQRFKEKESLIANNNINNNNNNLLWHYDINNWIKNNDNLYQHRVQIHLEILIIKTMI